MAGRISDRIRGGASTASSITALCAYLSEALCGDPATVLAGEAVEGLREMASGLSNYLHDIAEDASRS